jgi:predicted nucleic acid-binding protein
VTDAVAAWFLDTNILLRLAPREDQTYAATGPTLRRLLADRASLYYCPQNVVELWNVLTRPVNRNGFGFSAPEAELEVRLIERGFTLVPDHEGIYPIWRQLVNNHGVLGRQVHDARIVATMKYYGIPNLLTLNGPDFARYTGIRVADPGELILK